jgi:hypothetical protein
VSHVVISTGNADGCFVHAAPVAVSQRDGTVLWTGPGLWIGEMVNPSVVVCGGQVYLAGQHGMHVFALPN